MSVAGIGSGQSQIYLDITVVAGTSVIATRSGLGVVSSAQQAGLAGSDGRVRLTWTVNTRGSYRGHRHRRQFPHQRERLGPVAVTSALFRVYFGGVNSPIST